MFLLDPGDIWKTERMAGNGWIYAVVQLHQRSTSNNPVR
jgi:hypothetical protein